MADGPIVGLPTFTEPLDSAIFYVVDPTDVTDSPEGTSKQALATVARGYPRAQWEIDEGTPITNWEYPPGNVLRYGASPLGIIDSTVAFNLATRSNHQSTSNEDLGFAKEVIVPGGAYKISSSVFIHKGQHLKGAGDGATRILLAASFGFGDHIFKMGTYDTGAGDGFDLGGLAPEISGLWTEGGPGGAAVVRCGSAGASIHNMFLTAPDIGLQVDGTDVRVNNILIDLGFTGMRVGGHDNIFSNILIYSVDVGIQTINGGGVCSDNIFSDVHTYFCEVNGVLLDTSVVHKNLSFHYCNFHLNEQFPTFTGFVRVESSNAQNVVFSNCMFANMKDAAVIGASSALDNEIAFNDCIFDGRPSVGGYTASTTAYACFMAGSQYQFNDCEFKNLLGTNGPLWTNGAGAISRLLVRGGMAENNVGTNLVFVSASAPVSGSHIMVEDVWFKDERKQAIGQQDGWYVSNDAGHVLTGIGATPILQFPAGRKSMFLIDTSTSAAQVYLPRTADPDTVEPKHGDQMTFVDYSQDWGTNDVTFLRGDHTINGLASDLVVAVDNSRVVLTFNSVTGDWLAHTIN